jgi:isoleucyl-tRNA synthetase
VLRLRLSLAEFEIEYADKKSHAGRGLRAPSRPSWPPPSACRAGQAAFIVIWTTTAWTIPANQALNLNPELPYALVDTERGLLVVAEALVEKCLARWPGRQVLATAQGEKLGLLNFKHPLADVDPATTASPVYLADYATADDGTGIVHSAPAYGVDDFNSCVAHGLATTTS